MADAKDQVTTWWLPVPGTDRLDIEITPEGWTASITYNDAAPLGAATPGATLIPVHISAHASEQAS